MNLPHSSRVNKKSFISGSTKRKNCLNDVRGVYGSIDFTGDKSGQNLRLARSQNDIREMDDEVCNLPMKIEELNLKVIDDKSELNQDSEKFFEENKSPCNTQRVPQMTKNSSKV